MSSSSVTDPYRMFQSLRDRAAVIQSLSLLNPTSDPSQPILDRNAHIQYLRSHLTCPSLSYRYTSLDASLPWICYWIVHSLQLLGYQLTESERSCVLLTLRTCKCTGSGTEGYSGNGTVKLVHLASTYAAVACLLELDAEGNGSLLKKELNLQWLKETLLRLKVGDSGAFLMHEDGEQDMRAVYCALAVAAMCNILDWEIGAGVARYVARCQGFDGGLGPVPYVESHGGYTYCGLAALAIIRSISNYCSSAQSNNPKDSNENECEKRTQSTVSDECVDFDALAEWCCRRQAVGMADVGGMQGRTNKLVDGCYSFWIGASIWILASEFGYILHGSDNFSGCSGTEISSLIYDQYAMQEFILRFCQDSDDDGAKSSGSKGGLRDKPGEMADLYHTCYCLSGLAVAQMDAYVYANEQNLLPVTCKLTLDNRGCLNPIFNVLQSCLMNSSIDT